ncbi:MAG: M20 family metallopeptidase [Phycisphaerae bacterium]|nr:M20 family metallopeptidase [Phycisphaerae bacterium]
MPDPISDRLSDIFERLVALRHELHSMPELAYQEKQTSARLAACLGEIPGLDVRTGLARGTGIVATLNTGRPGPVVALRADIDALSIQEQNDVAYASKNKGLMHACGHDGHAACLVGAATVLASMRDQLSGVVRFIFQPAEEDGRGADAMIRDGALNDPPVQAIFGLHGWAALAVGQMATRAGALMASTDGFRATIVGRGCHGAAPHLGIDPIVAASHVVVALQSIVARTMDPLKSGVVTVGKLHAGTAINVIPPQAELSGTIRALDADVREHLRTQVEQVIRHTAAAHGCRADIALDGGYPLVVNDAKMAQFVVDTATDILGKDNVDAARPPSMGGEDFSCYLEKVPGCFFFIGLCPRGRTDFPAIHSPTFDFTDEAIAVGVRLFCELVLHARGGALNG